MGQLPAQDKYYHGIYHPGWRASQLQTNIHAYVTHDVLRGQAWTLREKQNHTQVESVYRHGEVLLGSNLSNATNHFVSKRWTNHFITLTKPNKVLLWRIQRRQFVLSGDSCLRYVTIDACYRTEDCVLWTSPGRDVIKDMVPIVPVWVDGGLATVMCVGSYIRTLLSKCLCVTWERAYLFQTEVDHFRVMFIPEGLCVCDCVWDRGWGVSVSVVKTQSLSAHTDYTKVMCVYVFRSPSPFDCFRV